MRRRPRFKTTLAKVRKAMLRVVAHPFNRVSSTTGFLLGFALLTFITTLLLAVNHSGVPAEAYAMGDVVRGTIVSPADVTNVDAHETERRRVAVIEATRPVWIFDPTRAENMRQSFRSAWRSLQRQTEARRSGESRGDTTWSGPGDAEAIIRALSAHRFDAGALELLERMLREANEGFVYRDAEAAYLKPEIRLVDTRSGAQSVIITAQNRLTVLSAARQSLQTRLGQLSGWRTEERKALASAILPSIAPTISFDLAATEAARQAAADAVPSAIVSVKRNQIIAREGDTVTEPMLAQFAALRGYGYTKRRPHHLVGLFFIVGALYWTAWRITERRSAAINLLLSKGKAFALVGSAVIVETVLMRLGFTVADSLAAQSLLPPLNDPVAWSFAIPFAAAALLVAILLDTHLALITGLITALFAGLLAPNGMLMAFYAIISSSAAIYGIGRYRERQSVTLAGLFVGAVNAATALAVILCAQRPLTLNAALFVIACGMAGGLLTTIFTAGGLPINESVFDILTDVKLLELSNADLPVLGQLAMRAPGTNQHSHAVGQLAEDACRAIGCNALLARIGALYHDIGKLGAPQMFVENQTEENPHERLHPTESAHIITSHVTYGLKLAREIHLPKQISDFIPQHHGTRTLHFFLRKAQAEAAPGETINDDDFRYPGPKPQFKEAAVMMLADSCEAAARSLARPDPENIRLIVNKIFDAVMSDDQLDECDLSLRELMVIRQSIITSLTAIYHARIDYPGYNPPSLGGTSMPSGPNGKERRSVMRTGYNKPSEVPISPGGEVEDEAQAGKVKQRGR